MHKTIIARSLEIPRYMQLPPYYLFIIKRRFLGFRHVRRNQVKTFLNLEEITEVLIVSTT